MSAEGPLVECDWCGSRWLRVEAMHHVPREGKGVRYWCGDCPRDGTAPVRADVPEKTSHSLGLTPIAETREGIGLILLTPPWRAGFAPGCYVFEKPLHVSRATNEARVLVVDAWCRVPPFFPGILPDAAGNVVGGMVGGTRLSEQSLALVVEAWGNNGLLFAEVRGFVGAWKTRRGSEAIAVAALAPLAPLGRDVRDERES